MIMIIDVFEVYLSHNRSKYSKLLFFSLPKSYNFKSVSKCLSYDVWV